MAELPPKPEELQQDPLKRLEQIEREITLLDQQINALENEHANEPNKTRKEVLGFHLKDLYNQKGRFMLEKRALTDKK